MTLRDSETAASLVREQFGIHNDRKGGMTLEQMCYLTGLVRFAQADAMLKAREA